MLIRASLVWRKPIWPKADLAESPLARTHLAEKWSKILQKLIETT
jgi:hypothetical protein